MLKTVLKITGKVLLVAVDVMLSDDDSQRDHDQLQQLNDGLGNIIADGNDYTQSEAKDAQARGELYDTFL